MEEYIDLSCILRTSASYIHVLGDTVQGDESRESKL